MTIILTLGFASIALGAVYFLAASGLSLIYGLMDILNFAHGMFMTLGAFAGWEAVTRLPASWGVTWLFVVAIATSIICGALAAAFTEVVLIRPLYGRPLSQVLVTIGLDIAVVALLFGAYGSTSLQIPVPIWLVEVGRFGKVILPHSDFLAIVAGIIVLVLLEWFLIRTRYGIIIRAGVENREMVSALGINVGRAFTLVFVIGGAMAGLAGLLYSVVFAGSLVSATQGDSLIIFAFIVVVIGGLGSVRGSAVAALLVAFIQEYTNYYLGAHAGLAQIGNLSVVIVLVLVLEVRPRGLFGRVV